MERKNSYGWIVALVLVIGALAAAAVLFFRAERRMLRLVGMIENYLPRKRKNTEIRVDL